MKRAILFTALSCLSIFAFSQTKRVAHRSHSGSNATFSIFGAGNFGLPVEDSARKTKVKNKTKNDTLKSKTPVKDTMKTPPSTEGPMPGSVSFTNNHWSLALAVGQSALAF